MDCDIREAALAYYGRGWTVLPVKNGAKKPALKWKRYQTQRPPIEYVRRWFDRQDRGIAVIFGQTSGNLGSRDFDDLGAYTQWETENPALASQLPTVETRRGRHVYFRFDADDMRGIRHDLGKPDGNGAIDCGDGELRAGDGCYSLVPPSLHPSGHIYRWLTCPNDLPIIDIRGSGLFKKHHVTECPEWDGGLQRVTEEIGVSACEWSDEILYAVTSTIPSSPGLRHRQVFELCRSLKAIPRLASLKPRDLKPIIREWHRRAYPTIGTKDFEETYGDFISGWKSVKYPKGADPITAIWEAAIHKELPPVALQYDGDEIKRLVALCHELQQISGSEPFYISCRKAGELLGVTHAHANRWLRVLIEDGVIIEVSKGSISARKASRYRYANDQ